MTVGAVRAVTITAVGVTATVAVSVASTVPIAGASHRRARGVGEGTGDVFALSDISV